MDDLQYGNPTQEQLRYLKADSPLDALVADLLQAGPPRASSAAVKEELNALAEWSRELSHKPDALKQSRVYDRGLHLYFSEMHGADTRANVEYMELLDSLFSELLPLVYKLKYHFNRPRPYQLAAAYKLTFFPYGSATAASPSYPSGAALVSAVVCDVLGNLNPKSYAGYKSLAKDVARSRQFMGLNYPSDIDASLLAAEKILADPEFKGRYGL